MQEYNITLHFDFNRKYEVIVGATSAEAATIKAISMSQDYNIAALINGSEGRVNINLNKIEIKEVF